jgi:RHS repeat-associated protein
MLTLSKPISAGQAQAYHRSEFANAKENYYTEGERVRGVWQRQLAERWGLRGEVNEEQFARLSEGQHPATGEALVRRQQAREYVNERGETVRTMEHRAGWDATFSAPKSVSVTALVGGDDRVGDAHRESVRVALDEMEKYAQARIGGNAPAQTTGAWAVAKFEAKGKLSQFSCNLNPDTNGNPTNGFTVTHEYLHDASGGQFTEFDGQGLWLHTNVFAEGRIVATYKDDGQGVHFHLTDWLGTRRVQTDYKGDPELQCQGGSFGDALICSPITSNAADATEIHFTGKERDTESGLDYFGARYYASSMGRYLSPDPSMEGSGS